MRFRFPLLIALLSLTFSSFGVYLGNLEYRDDVYCVSNYDHPYTGYLEGKHQGLSINGFREGLWISQWSSQFARLLSERKNDGLWIG